MTTRIGDMPVYAARDDQLDASLYNLWRRARAHHDLPMRIPLQGLKQMVLILEDDKWVIVDQNQYDLPVLAWVDFQDRQRSALHTPVPCTLNYYHFMASGLRARVLKLMEAALERHLHNLPRKTV